MKFAERTLKTIEAIEIDSEGDSLFHNLSPLSKVIATFIFLIAMLMLHTLYALFALLLLLSFYSAVFEKRVFRVWLFIPLFTGMIALPAIFLVPGKTVYTLGLLNITDSGIKAALFLILRATISVTAVALLTRTTRWEDVISSLNKLKVPWIFTLMLLLTFRYIFFFVRIVRKTLLSIKSRAIGKERSVSTWKLYAPLVGNLFIKSYGMQEKVYLSMISRGFNGKSFYAKDMKTDKWFIALTILQVSLLFIMDGDIQWLLQYLPM